MKCSKDQLLEAVGKEANTKRDFKQIWQTINKAIKTESKKLISPTSPTQDGLPTSCTKAIANI